MSAERAVVTGGCGFIGSHMVDLLLREGHAVTVIDDLSRGRRANLEQHASNGDLRIVETDVARGRELADAFEGADWVFHFAALADIVPSIEHPQEYMRANVDGTVGALEAARRAGVKRFVYSASSSCYGIPDRYPTPESSPMRPEYPYALSKLLGEQTALHWAKVYHLPVVSLRYFNVYGPRSRASGTYGAVLGVFLAQKLHGRPFTVVGDGTQVRDFVHVTDVARANLMAARSDVPAGVFNVGTGDPQSVNRLVELIGGGEVVHLPKRPGEPDRTHADTRLIRKTLGWEPRVTFEDGVRDVVERIESWRDAPLWDVSSIERATRTWFDHLGR